MVKIIHGNFPNHKKSTSQPPEDVSNGNIPKIPFIGSKISSILGKKSPCLPGKYYIDFYPIQELRSFLESHIDSTIYKKLQFLKEEVKMQYGENISKNFQDYLSSQNHFFSLREREIQFGCIIKKIFDILVNQKDIEFSYDREEIQQSINFLISRDIYEVSKFLFSQFHNNSQGSLSFEKRYLFENYYSEVRLHTSHYIKELFHNIYDELFEGGAIPEHIKNLEKKYTLSLQEDIYFFYITFEYLTQYQPFPIPYNQEYILEQIGDYIFGLKSHFKKEFLYEMK